MSFKTISAIVLPLFCLLLASCNDSGNSPVQTLSQASPVGEDKANTPRPGTGAQDTESCDSSDGIAYLCGVINGEDILQLGDSPWLVVSGMSGALAGTDIKGRIHLVNADEKSVEILFPGNAPVFSLDEEFYSQCPGPMDTDNFSAHGLALLKSSKGPEIYRLYMTSHGAREAIEVFEIDAFLKPTITWVGCIPMPVTSWTNSVAILEDGGFLATQFYDPGQHDIGNVLAGEITGHVFEWHPRGQVSVVKGTETSGANGIAVSGDGRWIFVAAFGTNELMRFDRSSTPVGREAIALDIVPDNVRWTDTGSLYVAGNNTPGFCGEPACEAGWSVIEVTPYNMRTVRVAGAGANSALRNASSALPVGDEIWVGTYGGDRLAILPR